MERRKKNGSGIRVAGASGLLLEMFAGGILSPVETRESPKAEVMPEMSPMEEPLAELFAEALADDIAGKNLHALVKSKLSGPKFGFGVVVTCGGNLFGDPGGDAREAEAFLRAVAGKACFVRLCVAGRFRHSHGKLEHSFDMPMRKLLPEDPVFREGEEPVTDIMGLLMRFGAAEPGPKFLLEKEISSVFRRFAYSIIGEYSDPDIVMP